MSKGNPEQLDFEQRVAFGGDDNRRRVNIMDVFKKGTEIEPLVDVLEVAAACLEKAEEFEPEKRLGLSCVFGYSFDFGADNDHTENPYWKINKVLLDGCVLSLRSVRGLAWGLVCGLRTLPYIQFTFLYRGLKNCV